MTCLLYSSQQPAFRGGGSGPPTPVTAVLIEGASQTSLSPGVDSGSYAWLWKAANPGLTINIRAQGSRGLGTPANLDDGGNTMYGHRTEDLAYPSQVMTMYVGHNSSLGGGPDLPAPYLAAIKTYFAPWRAAGKLIGLCTLTPHDYRWPAGNPTQYSAFNADATTLNALIRSDTSGVFDFVIPFGEIPEFYLTDGSTDNANLSDGIHFSTTGVSRTAEVYKAVMDPVVALSTATSPPAAAWFGADVLNADINQTLGFRYVVTGMRPGLGVAASIDATSISNGVKFQHGRTANLTSSTGVINGDVILLSVPTGPSYSANRDVSFTIGTRTILLQVRTAATQPAVITYDPAVKNAGVVLSNLNRRMTGSAGGANQRVRATGAVTGRRYAEMFFPTSSGGTTRKFGVTDAAFPIATSTTTANDPGAANYPNSGLTFYGTAVSLNGAGGSTGLGDLTDGVYGQIAIDTDFARIYLGRNNVWATGHRPAAPVTISIASPGVVTLMAHGLVNGAEVILDTDGALPTGLSGRTKYFVVNKTNDTFQLAATSGGAAINTSGTQSGVHTIASGGRILTTPIAQWYLWASSNLPSSVDLNCGQDAWLGTIPPGFLMWG